MPSTAKNLEHLPNELLVQCFSHLCKSSHTSSFIDNSPDIQRLRLVSKKCHANSSPLLIFSATVYITSASLFHLEELCSHPIFGKSINQVEINCSYYDVCMAESRGVYSYRCGSKLYQNLGNNPVDEMALYRMSDDWSALNKRGFLEKKPKLTENQQWLLDVHGQYKKLCEDQVRVKIDNAHIQRICTALMRLPQLHSLSLTDDPYYPVRRHPALSDADILERCLLTSTWKGSFPTAFFIRPPVEIIPDLFTALAQTDIRPTRIAIDLKPPNNLHCLKLPEPAQQVINTVVSRARNLSFKMQQWARKDSITEDNSRPRSEMLALCSLTSSYFDCSTLESLNLSFDEFPALHEPPTVSISEVLPLATQTWPQLHTLSLRYIPLTTADAKILVGSLRRQLRSFNCWCPWVVQGSWIDVINAFRELDTLQSFKIDYPKGGEFTDLPWDRSSTFPKQEVEEYVLRKAAENPMPRYFRTAEPDDVVP